MVDFFFLVVVVSEGLNVRVVDDIVWKRGGEMRDEKKIKIKKKRKKKGVVKIKRKRKKKWWRCIFICVHFFFSQIYPVVFQLVNVSVNCQSIRCMIITKKKKYKTGRRDGDLFLTAKTKKTQRRKSRSAKKGATMIWQPSNKTQR